MGALSSKPEAGHPHRLDPGQLPRGAMYPKLAKILVLNKVSLHAMLYYVMLLYGSFQKIRGPDIDPNGVESLLEGLPKRDLNFCKAPQELQNLMDSSALLRVDVGFYTRITTWAPLESLCKIHVLSACQKS